MARCRRRKTSVVARTIVPVVLGLGRLARSSLVVLNALAALSPEQRNARASSAPSVPIALGLYLAWAHPRLGPCHKSRGLWP